jgi:hypothetical protein
MLPHVNNFRLAPSPGFIETKVRVASQRTTGKVRQLLFCGRPSVRHLLIGQFRLRVSLFFL